MKPLRKQMLASGILLCLSMLLFLGTTIAYFTSKREISNTLTAGNVYVELTEAAVKADKEGNLVEDKTKPRIVGTEVETIHDYGTVFPGQIIHKDPTIKNTGSQSAWIAAKVTITDGAGDIHRIMGFDGYDGIDITMILDGGLLEEKIHVGSWNGHENVWYNDDFAMIQVPDRAEDKYDFYFFVQSALVSDESFTVFDTLTIPGYLSNQQLQELTDFKMTVRAFAVQTNGLENCYKAMKMAFPDYFTF